MNYHTHLECTKSGEHYPTDKPRNAVPGGLLYARYDLKRIKSEVSRDVVKEGPASLWRYGPLLPIAVEKAVTLGEGFTPLLQAPVLGAKLGCADVWVKDEGGNPSGTFKDRGAAVALSMYRELGVKTVSLNSSGNAGGSWSLYAVRSGVQCVNILPTDAQIASRQHCRATGQPTFLLEDWHKGGKLMADGCVANGWFNAGTLAEPYRTEGKKTMGLEIAEQLGWTLPDAVIYPMGGGLGAVAIWKAFEELLELGWVQGRMPRLYVTQYEGCSPVVAAYAAGESTTQPWGKKIDVLPGGLKSPNPPGGATVLALIKKYGGAAISVTSEESLEAVDQLASTEGIFPCPESATTVVGLRKALAAGMIKGSERVVLVSTGSGLKSIPVMAAPSFPVFTSASELHT